MSLPVEAWVFIASQILQAVAIYGGIRADLRHIREQVTRAHERIDGIMGIRR